MKGFLCNAKSTKKQATAGRCSVKPSIEIKRPLTPVLGGDDSFQTKTPLLLAKKKNKWANCLKHLKLHKFPPLL